MYIDYPRDQQNVVLIHRWFLHAGSITWKIYRCGQRKVAVIGMCYFNTGLYIQVIFRPGLTVLCNVPGTGFKVLAKRDT